ncbi:MAG: dihydrodipicolinate synthase family protein [Bacteroidota bacterium]
MHLPLKGIIPPLITPLNNFDELDIAGLERLIEHQISGGVHGLFILGTNGEAPSLSYKLRKEFIKKTHELVDKRIPVLVGITDTSFAGSMEIAEYANSAGADAVVVAPPYYFPVSDEEMVDYFEKLAPSLPLPFLLYNMPSHTKVHLSVDMVKRAKELGAVGIKDSSGDMLYLYSLIKEFKDSPEFSIITGTEMYLPETIMNGGHGAVAGGANMFPKLFVDLYNASATNDLETISMLRKKVMMLYQTIYRVGKHTSRYVKGTKCGLSVMGICNDYMAPPLHRFKPTERKQIEKYIEEITIM